MNEVQFVAKREPDWKRLIYLCDRADSSLKHLTQAEFKEFVRLYKRVSTDLAIARTKSSNLELIGFLNDLSARAYGILYRAPRTPLVKAIGNATVLAARTVRRRAWFIFASLSLFLGSGAFTYAVMHFYPESRDVFVPPQFEESFDRWKEGVHERPTADSAVAMAGFYSANNPRVAATTGAIAAATFGVGTAYMMFFNGAVLGSLLHEVASVGKAGFLLVSVLPHGVPELSGLVISGAAGFCLGYALINPGRRKRGEALKEAGKDAIVLLAVSVVLMFIAAPIEAFFSFNPDIPDIVKIVFIAVTAFLWMLFWTGFGRKGEEMSTE